MNAPPDKPRSLGSAATLPTPDAAADETLTETVRAASETARAPTLAAGSRIGGRYQIVRFLGIGGMGAVYLARDEALDGEKVALKFVRSGGGDALAALRREVLLAQRVTHHNVCRIYDLESIDGAWVVKMEYIDGVTLDAFMRERGPLSLSQSLAIAHRVARGLLAAHASAIVHRDLKPQNIMLEKSGRVVLMDFGIALAGGAASDALVGTPEFMAPEQVRGQGVDARADQYSFGCLLYWMLTGEPPFRATSRVAMLDQHLHAPPPDPRVARPELPPWIGPVVLRLLDKDPARRYADFAAVTSALGAPPRVLTPWRAVAVGALALVAAVGAFAIARHQRPAWHPRVQDQSALFEDDADAIAISPDGKQLAFAAQRDGTFRIVVGDIDGGGLRTVTPVEQRAVHVTWSHDGRSIFYRAGTAMNRHATLYRLSLADGTATVIGSGDCVADCGGTLLYSRRGAPDCPDCPRIVVDDGAGERELVRAKPSWQMGRMSCAPDGKQIVYEVDRAVEGTRPPADLWLISLDGSGARKLTDGGRNETPTFDPDGRSILYGSDRAGSLNIWELSLDSGAAEQLTFGDNDTAPVPTPDGKRLLFLSDTSRSQLFVNDVESGDRHQFTQSHDEVYFPTVAPDGALFAVSIVAGHAHVFGVTADGALQGSRGDGSFPCVSPDGRLLGFVERRAIGVMRLDGGERRILATMPDEVARLEFGGDGALHASIGDGTTVQAWRVPLDGAPAAREAPAPIAFALPAPTGGWRVVESVRGDGRVIELLPPDAAWPPPSGWTPSPRALPLRRPLWMHDSRAIVARRGQQVVRVDLDGHESVLVSRAGSRVATSIDGKKVYSTELVGGVRREVITNFGERPRPR